MNKTFILVAALFSPLALAQSCPSLFGNGGVWELWHL